MSTAPLSPLHQPLRDAFDLEHFFKTAHTNSGEERRNKSGARAACDSQQTRCLVRCCRQNKGVKRSIGWSKSRAGASRTPTSTLVPSDSLSPTDKRPLDKCGQAGGEAPATVVTGCRTAIRTKLRGEMGERGKGPPGGETQPTATLIPALAG